MTPFPKHILQAFNRLPGFALIVLGLAGISLHSADAQLPMYGNFGIHDPSTMIKEGSTYHVFGDGQGILILSSTNLRDWTSNQYVFPSAPPAWTTSTVPNFTGYFWAPDIVYTNGQYYLYYAASEWGTIESAIGLVTTPTLDRSSANYLWTDQGQVIASSATTSSPYNCIDPALLVDTNGTMWLVFGSYSNGIYVTQLNPATGKRLNTTSTRISNNGASFFTSTEEGAFVYKYNGYYYQFVNFGGCCSGVDSTYNIRVGRSASITGPYLDKTGVSMLSGGGTMFLESTGRYIGPGHAGILNDNGTYWFTYHYYDGNGGGAAKLAVNQLQWGADGWPTVTNDWSALYPYDVDAREHMGLYNGTLANGASIVAEPGRGKVLSLDGTSQYATVPLSVVNASTFSAWVKWNGGNDWQRIFDFGASTTAYLYLTPRNSTGNMRFAIRNGGAEQIIDAPAALPINTWCHVAVTLDGSTGVLYLNGSAVATKSGITIRPWQILAGNNYIGKSQFTTDPYFGGKIDSLRVFGRALSAAEIKDIAQAHPALAHRYSFASDARDSIGMAHGALMGNATITNNALQLTGSAGTYLNLPGGLVSGAAATTIESWVTFGTNANWARLYDFGNISGSSGSNYLYFTPHTSGTTSRISISTGAAAQDFDGAGVLDNQTVHLVCITDPSAGYSAVYANGVKQSELFHTLPPLTGVNSAWSFLGRSLFSADAWLNATIDEFRIYDGRLTPQQIAANFSAGPNALPILAPTLELTTPTGNPVTITGASTKLRVSAAMFNSGTQTVPAMTWSQVSGPGTVTFANAFVADTTALFSGTGAYLLQCTAVSASGTNTAQLNVMVNPSTDSTLALRLKLDENTGASAAADSSANANAGTAIGGVTWQPAGGPVAGTVLFDGSSGYINVPEASSLDVSSAFTLAFWLRANSLNSGGLVSKRDSNTANNAFTTYISSNGRLNVDIDTNNNRFTSNTVFTTGIWYHVTVVFDGSLAAAQRATLYVNGVLDKTATESSATVPISSSSLKLGIKHLGDTVWFNGNLDDVRLYRRALAPAEISAIANAGFTPSINPGAVPIATSGVAANLAGSVTNELGSSLTSAWSTITGPGTVTFGNALIPATSATFGQAGTYSLRLTGGNAAGETSTEFTINVTPNPNVYVDWVNSYFPGVTDSNVVGSQADPDHDNVKNIVEWALGLNPTIPEAAPWTAGKAGLPVQAWQNVGGTDYLSLQVRRPSGRIGMTYSAEVSSNLSDWNPAVQEGAAASNGDGSETVIFRDTMSRNDAAKRFIRLKLSQP